MDGFRFIKFSSYPMNWKKIADYCKKKVKFGFDKMQIKTNKVFALGTNIWLILYNGSFAREKKIYILHLLDGKICLSQFD